MKVTEFTVEAGDDRVTCALASPDDALLSENSGLLLNISATRQHALGDPTQNHATGPFLEAGHHVVTFDLPNHGERVNEHGSEIEGMSKAFAAGDDPFEQFIADGKAALDACLKRGVGKAGKVVAYGVSRAGYCCLRLAAADPRVRAVGAVSPVTDWAALQDWTDHTDWSSTSELDIVNWAEALAETAFHLSIGSNDDRVDTDACLRFATPLFQEQRKTLPEGKLLSQLHVVDSPGHSPSAYWRLDATRFLLRFLASSN